MKTKIRNTVLRAFILVILIISLTISAAPVLPAAAAPVSQYMYDNFDDNLTDSNLWYIELKDSGPTASETNQRLEITVPANSTGVDFAAWYDSVCQLRGDYDIRVDYEVLTWPLANGVRIGLADDHANMQRISSGRQGYDYPGGPDLYLTTFDTASHTVGITPTSDLSGKLRLERVGDTLTSYYFLSGAWILVASYSDPAYTQDTAFYLGAFSGDSVFMDQEVKVAFDNLMINAGELICPQTGAPDLAITQTADQAIVTTGDPINFDITVTNNGDATANIVTLSDILPTAAQLNWSVGGTDAAACVVTSGQLSCNFGDLAPGAVKSIRLTSPVLYSGKCFNPTITSTATAMAYNQPVNRSATASVSLVCPYIYIDVWSDNFSIAAGELASYTMTFGNMGDGIARDVVADMSLPDNPGLSWSIASVTPAEAANNCYYISGTESYPYPEIICNFAQMDPGQEVVVTATSPTTPGSCGMLTATGYATSTNSMYARTKHLYIAVNCPALPITMTADEGPFSAGDQIGFTVEVSNPGTDPAYGVTLIDTPAIPMDWLIDPAISPECSLSSGTWTCNVGTMAPNSTYSVHIYASSSPSMCGGIVENTASVRNSSGSSNTASASLVVDCPDLTITNTAIHETVSIGDPIGFDITVANNGLGTATDVTLSDTLPYLKAAQIEWSVSGTDAAACEPIYGQLSCNFGDLAPGAVKTIRLSSPTLYMDKSACSTISSTATVMASNQPESRSATASIEMLCPLVYIELSTDTPSITAGDPASFNIYMTNYGDGIARDVQAVTSLPENLGLSWSIASVSPNSAANSCSISGGTPSYPHPELICSFAQLDPGQEVTVTITSPTTPGSCGSLLATAGVTYSNGHGAKGIGASIAVNCPAGDTTPPVINPTISGTPGANSWYTSDASLTWSVSDPESAVSSTSGCENVSITQDQAATSYTCSATSAGGTASRSVSIARDATKPVTSVTGVSEGATYPLGSVPNAGCSTTDNLSGLATGASLTLTGGDVQGLGAITATCSGAVDIAGNPADPISLHYTVIASADVSLTKTDKKDMVRPGAKLEYILVMSNAGPVAAQSLTLQDTLDRDTTFYSFSAPSGWTCSYSNGKVICTSASLASGSSVTIRITVTVNRDAKVGKALVNNALVSSTTYDPNLLNNSAVRKTMVIK